MTRHNAMTSRLTLMILTAATAITTAACLTQAGDTWNWNQPQAKILPKGDLQWAPQPFEFLKGPSVRYIDYQSGDDDNPGTEKSKPWKHHPWDANATGQAAKASGVHTYVFKKGVVYRGFLQADDSGREGNPIRLTCDPDWGKGQAILSGAMRITGGWKKASGAEVPEGMPQAEKVWYYDLGTDFEPWALWEVAEDGSIVRMDIARNPNWVRDNPADPKSNWAQWTWPTKEQSPIGSRKARDEALKGKDEDFFQGAYCWSEWGGGIWGAMSLQYRSPVIDYDPETGALDRVVISPIFDGWATAGDRYFLEKLPQYLDSPGEYYYDAPTRWYPTAARQGFPWEGNWLKTDAKHPGRLYVRLPGDRDPNQAVIELGRRDQILRIFDQDHIEITGLTFQFTNVPYRPQKPDLPGWDSYTIHLQIALEPYMHPAAIMLGGNVTDVRIANNTFRHVASAVKGMPWRSPNAPENEVFQPVQGREYDEFAGIEVTDNDIEHVDHEGIDLTGNLHGGVAIDGPRLGRVAILRNRLHHISLRPKQSKNSPAIHIGGGVTLADIAGNEMIDCIGMGIYSVGGKGGGDERSFPLTRVLIYNNRADHVMLGANDWGAIAAWQGGPSYVFNNVASNVVGYKNHIYRAWEAKGKKGALPRYVSNAYPYYGDGTYKSYWFNNIGWSDYDPQTSPYRTQAGFMFVLGFQNYVFNNSIWNLRSGSSGSIGNRGGYLGNISAHMYAGLLGAGAKGDISVAGGGEAAVELNMGAINTVAFTRNLLANTRNAETIGGFGTGSWRDNTWQKVLRSLDQANPLVGDVGEVVDESPFRNASEHDFRPNEVAKKTHAVKFFVPWGLYATVGEWQFRHNPRVDPRVILGEHFFMTDEYVTRNMYYEIPRGDLIAPGATAQSYVPGPLTDWVPGGAMRFDGRDDFAMLSHEKLVADYETSLGFFDAKGDDGTMTRGKAEPIKKDREELERLEKLLANKGLKSPEKVQQKVEQLTKRVKQLESQGKDPARERKELARQKKLLEEGDVAMMKKLREGKIPQLKKAIEKKKARGVPERTIYPGSKRRTLNIDTGNLLMEAYLRTEQGHTNGTIAGKMGDKGYQLGVDADGKARFSISGNGQREGFSSIAAINDGKWHHVLAEMDRDKQIVRIYIDGKASGEFQARLAPDVSIANKADFLVGKDVEGHHLAGAIDFLRVSRGTLADAKTTIDELYAWQFHGPFRKDFRGRQRNWGQTPAGAIGE